MTKPKCQHCGNHPVNRPRRLCWGCYHRPGVKDLYPSSAHPRAQRGIGTSNTRSPLPEQTTTAPPGSWAKVEVMHARATRGEALFHPGDEADMSRVAECLAGLLAAA